MVASKLLRWFGGLFLVTCCLAQARNLASATITLRYTVPSRCQVQAASPQPGGPLVVQHNGDCADLHSISHNPVSSASNPSPGNPEPALTFDEESGSIFVVVRSK
jgi:hypothetical protein